MVAMGLIEKLGRMLIFLGLLMTLAGSAGCSSWCCWRGPRAAPADAGAGAAS